MESLKEFVYFDPATKEKIVDPDVTLSFGTSRRPVWRNKKGQIAENPNYWVGAETKGEQVNLSKISNSKALSPDQVLTAGQINNLEKAIKDKEAGVTAEIASQNKKAIIKNLTDSGVLQDEVMKAIVNTENLPILTKDFPRISKGINKVIRTAIKDKILAKGFSADNGTSTENGAATTKTAESIAKELINRYLVLTKVQSGRKDYTYTLLSVPSSMSESITEADPTAAPDSVASATTPDPTSGQPTSVQPPSNQVVSNSTDQTGKQSTEGATITIDNKTLAELTEDLAVVIEPLLTETNEAITSSAKIVKYHCSITGSTDDETLQEAEKQNGSNDSRIFRRLLEEDTAPDNSASQDNASTEEAVPSEVVTDEGKEPTTKANLGKALTLNAVKVVVDGLNKKGNTFDTPHTTYKLSYSASNVDTKNNSFDIFVTSSSTTPKEGFWKTFGKELKSELKSLPVQAGMQIVKDLAGNRGHMN